MSIDTTPEAAAADTAAALDQQAVEQFVMKVATDLGIGHNGVLAYLGDRLGLWRALADAPGCTSDDLAARCGFAERYVREWLAAQAAAGYVHYDPTTRGFTLPPEHAAVLADDESPVALASGFEVLASVWATVDGLAHAYATGGGVGWHEHDARLFTGFERFFRPVLRGQLVQEWLPAVPGLVDRLTSGIRVLDVGCGLGTATILMAEAFPASTFVGVDYHPESVRRATAAAAEAGVADRLHFEVADAASYDGAFDLVVFVDVVHDLGDPVGALAHAREHLAEGGSVLVIEPQAADRLEDNLHPLGLTWYASGHSICVAHSMSQGGAALGAQAGPARISGVVSQAGFGEVTKVADSLLNFVLSARP
ncbi:MAG TPA: class I SAM-dependent methyltransferase [Nocardioidaceae bacterium]|nr:class I SAM-dependent methyltransferase [Nocardioidaceae bacterium]